MDYGLKAQLSSAMWVCKASQSIGLHTLCGPSPQRLSFRYVLMGFDGSSVTSCCFNFHLFGYVWFNLRSRPQHILAQDTTWYCRTAVVFVAFLAFSWLLHSSALVSNLTSCDISHLTSHRFLRTLNLTHRLHRNAKSSPDWHGPVPTTKLCTLPR